MQQEHAMRLVRRAGQQGVVSLAIRASSVGKSSPQRSGWRRGIGVDRERAADAGCRGLCLLLLHAQQRYSASGLVLSVDRSQQTMLVSCQEVRGFMDAMVMSFSVPDGKSLGVLRRGALIEFTLVVNKDSSHAEEIRIRGYDSAEREPAKARRLQGLEEALRGPGHRLAVGEGVPDFTLTDQQKRGVHFRQFSGKVVAMNFVYTRCTLPEYCLRSSNNFGALQKQFQERLGKDLVLLTVTFDPASKRVDYHFN